MTRCSATWWLAPHVVLMARKRDAAGAVVSPATLVWECLRCGRHLGETVMWPRAPREPPPAPRPAARLLAFMRRHVTPE